MKHETINIGTWMISSEVNGPGRRLVIWLQGCRLKCPGCLNQEFWDEHTGRTVLTADIKDRIKRLNGTIEGITFSGGEPMLQAQSLAPLARWIRKQGIGLVSYSGYTFEELTTSGKVPYAEELLNELDLLIDGPFLLAEKAPLIWRGSRNQKVRFLTNRYIGYLNIENREGACQAELRSNGGQLAMPGFFSPALWQRLQEKLKNNNKAHPLPLHNRR
jgi:anaerobic ribonucleoside-triphosphate reductase activating protein